MKNHTYQLKNGRSIYCEKPTLVGAEEVIANFDEQFRRFIGGKPMWAIDVGTSCGDSSIVMAANMAPESRVICFEPSRMIRPLLMANLSRNTDLKVEFDVFPVAAGDSYSFSGFFYHVDNGGLEQSEVQMPRNNFSIVPVVNTFEYLKFHYVPDELFKVGFIKIDTEGYDYVVLHGLAPLIMKCRMPIVCEWWNSKTISDKLFNNIECLGYTPFNSRDEAVTAEDFYSNKRTQDLFLLPK